MVEWSFNFFASFFIIVLFCSRQEAFSFSILLGSLDIWSLFSYVNIFLVILYLHLLRYVLPSSPPSIFLSFLSSFLLFFALCHIPNYDDEGLVIQEMFHLCILQLKTMAYYRKEKLFHRLKNIVELFWYIN